MEELKKRGLLSKCDVVENKRLASDGELEAVHERPYIRRMKNTTKVRLQLSSLFPCSSCLVHMVRRLRDLLFVVISSFHFISFHCVHFDLSPHCGSLHNRSIVVMPSISKNYRCVPMSSHHFFQLSESELRVTEDGVNSIFLTHDTFHIASKAAGAVLEASEVKLLGSKGLPRIKSLAVPLEDSLNIVSRTF
ncbi:unnamed protein product [Haemonchus placei]|uniref:Histone deacetylase n=1 Tax=Haemonchus placei TaxID=6290 RepID=A0A0N4WRW7_HAEPC|nr:unnamed protein product [Haemonchus placei]